MNWRSGGIRLWLMVSAAWIGITTWAMSDAVFQSYDPSGDVFHDVPGVTASLLAGIEKERREAILIIIGGPIAPPSGICGLLDNRRASDEIKRGHSRFLTPSLPPVGRGIADQSRRARRPPCRSCARASRARRHAAKSDVAAARCKRRRLGAVHRPWATLLPGTPLNQRGRQLRRPIASIFVCNRVSSVVSKPIRCREASAVS